MKSSFAESDDYSKISTQIWWLEIVVQCQLLENFVKLLITRKLKFWHLRNNPLFFAESEHRINTCLQPFLQIFNKFFIIFCRIRIFVNKIFFYFIKLMNFQFCRIIFLDGFSNWCWLDSALILYRGQIDYQRAQIQNPAWSCYIYSWTDRTFDQI